MVYYEIEINSTRIKCENIFEEVWEQLDDYYERMGEKGPMNGLYESLRKVKVIRGILNESLKKFGGKRDVVREREYDDIFNELYKIHEEIIYEMEFPYEDRNLERRKIREIMEENYEEAGKIQKNLQLRFEWDAKEIMEKSF